MSDDIRLKRQWMLAITQGRWQVMEGETLNLTGVGFVDVVPKAELNQLRASRDELAGALREISRLQGAGSGSVENRRERLIKMGQTARQALASLDEKEAQ